MISILAMALGMALGICCGVVHSKIRGWQRSTRVILRDEEEEIEFEDII